MCNSIPNPSLAPAPRSYHLLTTLSPIHGHKLLGTLYPYRTRICCWYSENSLFSTKLTSPSPPQHRHHRHLQIACSKCSSLRSASGHIIRYTSGERHRRKNQRGKVYTFHTSIDKKAARGACAPLRHWYYYQLAFFTPGIRPLDAISRNWIRLIPNWRI